MEVETEAPVTADDYEKLILAVDDCCKNCSNFC